MKRWIVAVLGSTALIACGLVHGFWTDRWGPTVEAEQAAQRLATIPLEIGDWEGEEIPTKPGEAGEDVAGCIRRHYAHRKSGAVVSLVLVCGRGGPVSIHEPEACYPAHGFTLGAKERYECDPGEGLWKADALRTSATEEKRVRLYWGWNDGSGWTAPEEPRDFAHRPVLHKLYVQRDRSDPNESLRAEPCEEFLQALLPALRRTLFAPTP
jgi:hypothetical protein